MYDRRRRTTRRRCTVRHSMGTRKWWHSCCNTDATPASATAGENPRWISPRNMAGKLHVRFFPPFSPSLLLFAHIFVPFIFISMYSFHLFCIFVYVRSCFIILTLSNGSSLQNRAVLELVFRNCSHIIDRPEWIIDDAANWLCASSVKLIIFYRLETVQLLVSTYPELIVPLRNSSSSVIFPHTPLHLASRNGHRWVFVNMYFFVFSIAMIFVEIT